MKKNKGFTMVELLAVIIILGVISTLAIAGINGILKRTKKSYLDGQNQMVVLAGKTYYSDHRSKLPKVIGPIHEVKLETLVDLKYIDPVKDDEGNPCIISADGKESTVYVQKVSKEEYKYRGYLYCNGEESGVYDKTPPNVILTPPKTTTISKKPLTVTLKAEDEGGVLSYRYIIYKDGKEYKDTGYKNYKKKVEIVLKETGKYTIKAYAYDNAGNRGSTEGGIYEIKIEKPNCNKVTISAGVNPLDKNNHGWTKNNITVTARKGDTSIESWSLKDNGKTIIKRSTSNSKKTTLTTEGKHTITFTGYNAEGISCTAASVEYGIDKTPPKLDVILTKSKGGSYPANEWYSGTVTAKGIGIDKLSPVTVSYTVGGVDAQRGASKKTEKPGKSKEVSLSREIVNEGQSSIQYKVEDDAGNVTTGTSYGVRLDRTPPTKPSLSGNPGKWVNYSFKLTGTTKETLSGVKKWEYKFAGGWTTYSGSAGKLTFTTTNFSKERNENVYIRVTDNAGNVSPSATSKIQIDKTKPTCSTSKSNTGKQSGVTVSITCKDNKKEVNSGVASCPSKQTGVKSDKTYTVKDKAGNSNTCSVKVTKYRMYRRRECATCKRCKSAPCEKSSWKNTRFTSCRESNKTVTQGSKRYTSCKAGGQCTIGTAMWECVIQEKTCDRHKESCSKCNCESWGKWTGYNYISCSSSKSRQCDSAYFYK